MDHRSQRPPRSARPPQASSPPSYPADNPNVPHRPPFAPSEPLRGISFQDNERGDRQDYIDQNRQHAYSAYRTQSPTSPEPGYLEAGGLDSRVGRKKSLVRPDREKVEPGHRLWHYQQHAAQMQDEGGGNALPSTTGNAPQRAELRRGKSLLGREEDVHESGLALFKRGTLRRRRPSQTSVPTATEDKSKAKRCCDNIGPGPKDAWFIYCYVLTCWVPPFLLRVCGIRTPEQQRAWREKIGLIGIILCEMAAVGFITFGFTETVCGTPPNRFHAGSIENASVIIHGFDYDFSHFDHPAVGPFDGKTNPLFVGGWNAAGADISFLFQNVGGNCASFITKAANSTIASNGQMPEWYFPCNIFNQFGTSGVNQSDYGDSTNCHVNSQARQQLASLTPQGQVYYTWDDVRNTDRNLVVFESSVLDLNLLQWLSSAYVSYPSIFNDFMHGNGTFNGKDLSMWFLRTNQRDLGRCLQDIVTVGFIDTNSIGCVASQVVLYVSLVFIVGVVGIRFFMAVLFAWFFSWKIGNFGKETYQQRMQRAAEIENWADDIYRPAPSYLRPNVQKNGLYKGNKKHNFLPSTSRFTPAENMLKGVGIGSRSSTAYGMLEPMPYKKSTASVYGSTTAYAPSGRSVSKLSPPDTPAYRQSRSSTSLDGSRGMFADSPCPFPLLNVVPQPPPDYEPFNFPLAHTICLVTAYSESVEGLRTTIDSLATTDYPNSHKLILVIADGMVKGAGNTMTTPEICLSMMKELIIPPEEVEPHSYVAIADGHKRHNMAKVYAGFYDYDDATVERSKQQRVPIVLVAKCGNPLEANDPKPGNRGKRDSQIVLMAFLQKVMFDERMTTFEYEFFNSIWRVTGVSPDRYELVLCVDADTKVFPDSLSRMIACMVHDHEVMGVCGETKIANKADSWVTMMQVFEYYISHHMTKAFESMFGGVTCLPGCFSMYRIKAPKGESGYWVPVLANPDIVEHYSENVVDTLHKKNLLLLGEDRYLTTLMLKTFPKRKNIFCPQSVCKTIVPDTFRVLLSQRRRWINSTVHNLFELLLVRDLCGTFCFSMQFVVGMELAGTLVLPAAISFTLYLIIISIIPGGTNTTIPLILLAIILGLPGFLIVITSRKIVYIGWMLVYLLSLPVWNGILPAYAFWHFDDFSWGQTRQIAGEKKDSHGDKEGEFDSSHIVMKRWAEFERERRWKSGSQSRDSTYYDYTSPKKSESNRQSFISTADTNQPTTYSDQNTYESSTAPTPRQRHDSNQLLMLPAPLAANRGVAGSATSASVSTTALSRSSEEDSTSDIGSAQRLVSSPQDMYASQGDHQSPFSEQYYAAQQHPQQSYQQHYAQQQHSQYSQQAYAQDPNAFEARVSRTARSQSGVLRQGTVSSQFPGETHNPYGYSQPQSVYDEAQSHIPFSTEPEDMSSVPPLTGPSRARGISLADNGPVPGPGGVRRVSRQTGRRTSAQAPPPQNRYSRPTPSPYTNLPPGAAPPNTGYGY
ncbi:glycosyltransferase family 2 protein [Gelatoporia subvermispora B]|uniref:chitin synthase n=1 Tax=Ceriporiopsis subvermispora (strain B) TaxID=914234 RepID=M2R1B3_CERS8|nr:glycosyltransferase family 2 protein [Gelatoporia subvermispora B]